MNTIEEIAGSLKRIRSAVIFTHMRPDGDTVGSALALSRALGILGIQNEVVNEGEIPEKFSYLDGYGKIRRVPSRDAEGYICVDVSDIYRLGTLQEIYLRSARRKVTFNIDHHISNPRFAKYNYVRDCASNCENIAALIAALGVERDKAISECLLTGLVTDSGSFSHDDVTGDTLRLAASCVDGGADIRTVTYEAFKRQSKPRAQFYAAVISEIRYLLGDKLAIAYVRADLLKRYDLKQDATEGIVDFALNVDVVEVSVCILEVKKGQYKISLRSKHADVNEIARVFGGGGHIRAAGCMLFGDIEDVIDKLRFTVQQYLDL